jgi:FMN phosphatase YigB (HAD superfamily)
MTLHRAWLIDLDGTLYRSRPVKLAMAAELLTGGPKVWRVVREFRRQHELLRAASPSDGNQFSLQIRETASSLEIAEEDVQRVIQEWMFERPGRWLQRFQRTELLSAIHEFRADGGLTALVSDYPATTKLRAMGIAELFDVVVANGEPDGAARLKPAPDGYLKAAARLSVDPGECLVIGDRFDADGMAACYAGIDFCHVRDAGQLEARRKESSDVWVAGSTARELNSLDSRDLQLLKK